MHFKTIEYQGTFAVLVLTINEEHVEIKMYQGTPLSFHPERSNVLYENRCLLANLETQMRLCDKVLKDHHTATTPSETEVTLMKFGFNKWIKSFDMQP